MSKVTGGRAMRTMASEKKKGSDKKKVHRMEIRHANGGFVVTHHAKPDPGTMPQDPEEHVVPDSAALQAHVAQNMGEPDESAPAPAGAAQAAPDQGEHGQ